MFRKKFEGYVRQFRELNGDPHYVALGMAIGVFIAITPTIPFHTVAAIGLAFLLKASKPAAYLGVWVSNPATIVFLYYACYKTGYLFFQDSPQTLADLENLLYQFESDVSLGQKIDCFKGFITDQFDVFLIMNLGGLILGLPAGVAAYVITKRIFIRMRAESGQEEAV